MKISHLDHLVLTVKDIQATCAFYTNILGMQEITFKQTRKALVFGQQKINLHQWKHEFEPKAAQPTPGSEDLCFIVKDDLNTVIQHLEKNNIKIIEGPIQRTGAVGSINSVYIRDPDDNLIELSVYES